MKEKSLIKSQCLMFYVYIIILVNRDALSSSAHLSIEVWSSDESRQTEGKNSPCGETVLRRTKTRRLKNFNHKNRKKIQFNTTKSFLFSLFHC